MFRHSPRIFASVVSVASVVALLVFAVQFTTPVGQASAAPVGTTAIDELLAKGRAALAAGDTKAAIDGALAVRRAEPRSEPAISLLVDALAAAGRSDEALTEATWLIANGSASGHLIAQRGFLRLKLHLPTGAIEDFRAALASGDLSEAEAANVRVATAEAQAELARYPREPADIQATMAKAYAALGEKNGKQALTLARQVLTKDRNSENAALIVVDALTLLGHANEALSEATRFIGSGMPNGRLHAQRGYLRRSVQDLSGAIADFKTAMASHELDEKEVALARTAMAEATTAGTAPPPSSSEQAMSHAPVAPDEAAAGAAGPPLPSPFEQAMKRAYDALAAKHFDITLAAVRGALKLDPTSKTAAALLVDALTQAGRTTEATAAITRFADAGIASSQLYAQRGYWRREKQDLPGAIADFKAALAARDLGVDETANVRKALNEATVALNRPADQLSPLADALNAAHQAIDRGNDKAALATARRAQRINSTSEEAARIVVDVLSRSGDRQAALAEASRYIARHKASGQILAQRGYLRREGEDYAGAAADFAAALSLDGLDRKQRGNIEIALAEAKAQQLETQGQTVAAEETLRTFADGHPRSADGWFNLGYFYRRQGRDGEAAVAFEHGLQFELRGSLFAEVGYAYSGIDDAKATHYLKRAVDHVSEHGGNDPDSERTLEELRNQIDVTDAGLRTTISADGTFLRPLDAGGRSYELSFETVARFDGRGLPRLQGMEAFMLGDWSRDQTGFQSGVLGFGLRYRPLRDVDLALSARFEHDFADESNDVLLGWGYGKGYLDYPYHEGVKPYWNASTSGSYSLVNSRVLSDFSAGAGVAAYNRGSGRTAMAASLLVAASYDSAATTPWAAGIGPNLLIRSWLGGDRYHASSSVLSVELGYFFHAAGSKRLSGLQTKISLSY